jgi:urea transport system ATP-binding protein
MDERIDSAQTESLLRVENVTVSFEGFKALENVSLSVSPQSVRVVVGPNGAGKSTLMDVIIGRVRPVSGRVMFKGTDITNLPEYLVVRRGVCRKFQTPGILPNLTVEENIVVAAKRRRGWFNTLRRSIPPSEQARVNEMLDLISLAPKRNMLAAHLAHGAKQWLEIGMVVASNGELLLLDEPAAGMTQQERAKTAALIRGLSQKHAFVVIDHDMDFVEQLEAPVSVLHMGKVLREGTIEQVRSDPQVRAVYLGRAEETDRAGA